MRLVRVMGLLLLVEPGVWIELMIGSRFKGDEREKCEYKYISCKIYARASHNMSILTAAP